MNILLIVLDSVRAKNCSLYGHRRETTPELDALAAEATVYDHARAPSNWTLPCHVSMFTGLETHVHEVTVHHRLNPGHTVFEWLANKGYKTGLFTENGFLASHEVGLKNAFETVETIPENTHDRYLTGKINDGPNGYYYADRFLSWAEDRGKPWAACLNLMDGHRPFEPAPPYDHWGDQRARRLQQELDLRWEPTFHGGDRPYWQLNGLESLYDGAIRQADAIVGYVTEHLREQGMLEETLLVVCGDHGDGFGEDGYLPGEPPAVSHIVPMHESLLHVPLIVRHPGGNGGDRISNPAALTRFPAVVRAAIDGGRASFVPDHLVVSTKLPVTADLKRQFEAASEAPEPLFAPSRAVYDTVGSVVRKRYHHGDAAGTLLTPSANASVVDRIDRDSETLTHTAIDEVFDRFEPQEVRSPRPDDELQTETKEQLRALGYY